MTCHSAWARRVKTEILTRYPNVLMVPARTYGRPRAIDTQLGRVTIPAVEKPPESGLNPLREAKKLLSLIYNPDDPPHTIVIQYHPLGGIAYVRQ